MSVEPQLVNVPARHRTGVAVASLVCGIAAMLLSVLWMFSMPLGAVAIILGVIGCIATSRDPQRQGRYQAIGGLVTGAIGMLVGVISIAFILPPGELGTDCTSVGNVTSCYYES